MSGSEPIKSTRKSSDSQGVSMNHEPSDRGSLFNEDEALSGQQLDQILGRSGCDSTSNTNLQLSKFFDGYQRFHKTYFAENKHLYQELQHGQAPKTVLIGCCDSRVDPAIITDCAPGDLFVIRNVANLVAPYGPDPGHHGTSAALEYAVKVLKVENIIILGHTHCGGIKELMKSELSEGFEFLGPWMSIAQQAKEKTIKFHGHEPIESQLKACEQASILQSLEHLLSYPWILEKLKNQTISITGWYFDFDTGELTAYNPCSSHFDPIVEVDILQEALSTTSMKLPVLRGLSYSIKNADPDAILPHLPQCHDNESHPKIESN